jgi:signal transduction histidine kinase
LLLVNRVTDPAFRAAVEQAKLEALAEFAAGAGHEINNPLATIRGRAQLLVRRLGTLLPAGEAQESIRDLHIIAGQVERIRDMIGDLMLFARPPVPQLEPCDLSVVAGEAVAALSSSVSLAGGNLLDDLHPVQIRADRTQVAVVVSELIRNALAAGSPPRIRIACFQADGEESTVGRLTVIDEGSGLSDKDHKHLFDPFYSGRQAGRGLGFGLCKCWRIVQMHRGRIDIRNREPAGIEATVDWPIAP